MRLSSSSSLKETSRMSLSMKRGGRGRCGHELVSAAPQISRAQPEIGGQEARGKRLRLGSFWSQFDLKRPAWRRGKRRCRFDILRLSTLLKATQIQESK